MLPSWSWRAVRLSSEVLAHAMHAENPLHAGIDGKGAAVDDKTDPDRG